MSVHSRAALFEDLSHANNAISQKPRSQSATTVPLIKISSDVEVAPELPARPNLALRPQRTAPPAPKPKPVRLKSRPTVPPKLPTDDGVLSNRSIADGPSRIQLFDRENDLSDDDHSTSSRPADESLSPQKVSLQVSGRSRSPTQKAIDKAKKRTKLIADSALDTGREKTKQVGVVINQSTSKVSKNAVKLKHEAVRAIERSGAPKAFDQATGTIRDGALKVKVGADGWLEKLGIPRVFAETKEDVQDIQANYAGKSGLCSKCRSFPAHLCFPGAFDCTSPEVFWATPLPRVIYHANWCRLCHLLIQMLCRRENDPLKHPAVANSLLPELRDMAFEEWVGKGWYYTDLHWPFGYGDERHEGATRVLGDVGSVVSEGSKEAFSWGIQLAGMVAIGSGVSSATRGPYIYQRPSKWYSVSDGVRRFQQHKPKYPLSCVLRLSIRTHVDFESPGLIFVDLFGHSSGSQPQAFERHFRLRAARPELPIRDLSLGPLSYGTLLDRDWIDISRMRNCLNACEKHHGSECSEHGFKDAMRQPDFVRLLDVVDLCIVTPPNPATCRFVALSYVWGKTKPPKLNDYLSLSMPGSLERFMPAMPHTIVDAFEVIRGLGERYLWVDALCIPQDNPKEAQEQIENMDRIYGSALLTVVAAEGADSSTGLVGVKRHDLSKFGAGKMRWIQQPLAEMQDGVHIIAPFANDQQVESSAWNSRAWTFQERLLSKRFLVFGAGEATWHCRQMTAREDMLVKDSGYGEPLQGWLSLRPEHLGVNVAEHWKDGSFEMTRHGETHLVRSGAFHEYAKMIEQYTHRSMTYDYDMLNALGGLLQIFEQSFKSDIAYGLPEVLFDIALLWRPTEQLMLRRDAGHGAAFPSWSWAGWKGRVAYDKPYTVQQGLARSPVRFARTDDGEEGVRPFLRWYHWSEKYSDLRALNGNGIGLPLDEQYLPKEWENPPSFSQRAKRPLRSTPPHLDPTMTLQLRNHHLIFETSCSRSFQFGDAVTQSSDRAWNASRPPLRYSLTKPDLESVGTVLLDGNGPDWLDPDRHEFILLGEAQFCGLDDERRDVEGYPLYLAMLIEWDNRTKIAYRIGMGRIKKTAWRQVGAEARSVVLG